MTNPTPLELAVTLRELCDEIKAQQEKNLSAIRKIADLIEAMDKPPIVSNLPNVLYRSQWGADADYVNSDCGPACVAMLLGFRGITVTVDEISVACGMGPNKKYTTAADLVNVSKKLGLELVAVSGWTLEQFAKQAPCIVLIHYADLKDRQDQNYTNGHWVVLLGVVGNDAVFHDPDYKAPRRDEGRECRVDVITFALAMRNCTMDGNRAGTGLVMAH